MGCVGRGCGALCFAKDSDDDGATPVQTPRKQGGGGNARGSPAKTVVSTPPTCIRRCLLAAEIFTPPPPHRLGSCLSNHLHASASFRQSTPQAAVADVR